MDYARLFVIADRARARRSLAREDVAFLRENVPAELAAFPKLERAPKIIHPSGFTVSGAPVGTFVKSALLIAGQRALGRRFGGAPFYERVEEDLAFRVMRSHFHHGYPKGTNCCAACTLATLPVLEANAIRYFDARGLAKNVRKLITEGGWRFASPQNPKMLRWALSRPSAEG